MHPPEAEAAAFIAVWPGWARRSLKLGSQGNSAAAVTNAWQGAEVAAVSVYPAGSWKVWEARRSTGPAAARCDPPPIASGTVIATAAAAARTAVSVRFTVRGR